VLIDERYKYDAPFFLATMGASLGALYLMLAVVAIVFTLRHI
jgi:hypothetical protein